MPLVLITCTQPRADWIVKDLNRSQIQAIAHPVLKVEKMNTKPPHGDFDALLITSPHAVIPDLPDLPVLAVGEYTANIARKNGMYVSHTGHAGVRNMDLSSFQHILYPCAKEPSFVPEKVTTWPAYKTVLNNNLEIDKRSTIICVFSVKAAIHVRDICNDSQHIICLSDAIASIFENHPIENLAVCKTPRYDEMTKLIHDKVKNL